MLVQYLVQKLLSANNGTATFSVWIYSEQLRKCCGHRKLHDYCVDQYLYHTHTLTQM